MAVQSQLYSDHYQTHHNIINNNNNMAFSNLPQDWAFISGSGSSGLDDQKSLTELFFENQRSIMSFTSEYHNIVSSSNRMVGFQNLSSEVERQRLEMDYFLHFQNEKLKAVLNEETRKREVMMMHNYESKMKTIIEAKDEVLNTAKTRTRELQNYLLMAEKEAKNWEKKAIESESMVTDLNTKINEARATRHEDAESVCNGGGDHDDEKMVCKICHVRSSCMLLLPCRHLCCCSGCEGLVMFCPVCETVKNGSLEVFFGLN